MHGGDLGDHFGAQLHLLTPGQGAGCENGTAHLAPRRLVHLDGLRLAGAAGQLGDQGHAHQQTRQHGEDDDFLHAGLR
ncbi:hypothetical protein D3C83_18640 [compost metagenome]